jgi:hypothetical protein
MGKTTQLRSAVALLLAAGLGHLSSISASPSACPTVGVSDSLSIAKDAGGSPAILSWGAHAGADGYDVVRGSLALLGSTGGDFTAATHACLASDTVDSSVEDAEVPAEGEGYWYLVRGVNLCIDGSYNAAATDTQVASRDPEVEDSGFCSSGPCVPGSDTDGDRLDDCDESNSWVFVDASDPGSDPNRADSDGDFIQDGDETLGSLAGLDLPALGSDPLRRDVFLEYDWFDDANQCAAHTHRPTQAMVDRITNAFAAAPRINLDRTTGIRVHQDHGQGGTFTGGNLVPDADGVIAGGVNGADFNAIKAAHFDPLRGGYFHYVLLPHRFNINSNASGQAETPGDDLVVTLACAIGTNAVSGSITHELGHNFGLHHGGFENCNCKPNYNSVMSYRYALNGVDTNCTPPTDFKLDYSSGTRPALDETDLDEAQGICGAPAAWDWNGNAVIESGVVQEINGACSGAGANADCGSALSILQDHDDWNALQFSGLADADFTRSFSKQITTCTP